MDGAIWGFVGVVVGGLITGLVTITAERMRADREVALDSAQRQDARRLARDGFQRENLLELQVKLVDWLRAMTEMYLADRDAIRSTGAVDVVPDELSTREATTTRELMVLTDRVLDDELRARLVALRELSAPATMARTAQDVEAANAAIVRAGSEAIDHIGRVLRTVL